MSTPDMPTLRSDGTLREASELEWIHSPSAEKKTLLPTLADLVDGNTSDKPASPKGLKGKEPATRVGGKHIPKPSARASESKKGHLDPKIKLFFSCFEGKKKFISLIFEFSTNDITLNRWLPITPRTCTNTHSPLHLSESPLHRCYSYLVCPN